jgi:hypothetical protein
MATKSKMAVKKNRPKMNPKNWWLVFTIIIAAILLIQIFYPNSNLPLGTKISGKDLSGWNKRSAIKELNRNYADAEVSIFLGASDEVFDVVSPADFGLEIDNKKRVDAINYPWFIRLIPTSLFWWGGFSASGNPTEKFDDIDLQDFVEEKFGLPCYVEPKNASLSIDGSSINISKSRIGGTCYQSEVAENFRDVVFSSTSSGSVKVSLITEQPDVTTDDATALAMKVSPNLVSDLTLEFDEIEKSASLSRDELASWVIFDVVDGELKLIIDKEKSSQFYKEKIAPLVEQAAGVTTIIATEDLNTVRIDGSFGRVINVNETNLRISEYLLGLRKTVAVAIESTDPSVSYVYNRPQPEAAEAEILPGENNTEETEIED